MATLAEAAGAGDDAKALRARSLSYRNLFDRELGPRPNPAYGSALEDQPA